MLELAVQGTGPSKKESAASALDHALDHEHSVEHGKRRRKQGSKQSGAVSSAEALAGGDSGDRAERCDDGREGDDGREQSRHDNEGNDEGNDEGGDGVKPSEEYDVIGEYKDPAKGRFYYANRRMGAVAWARGGAVAGRAAVDVLFDAALDERHEGE